MIFSSHVMEVVERLCSHVAILADGQIKRSARSTRCAAAASLEDVFVEVVGGRTATGEELAWL